MVGQWRLELGSVLCCRRRVDVLGASGTRALPTPPAFAPLQTFVLGTTLAVVISIMLLRPNHQPPPHPFPPNPSLQTFVLGTTLAVVVFIMLLQNPMLGSPTWLPLLGLGWLGAVSFTLALQGALPLPDSEQ